jgi:tryptophanyl-tRNA synthetase
LFELYECFASAEQVEDMRAQYARGIGWGTAKEALFVAMDEALKGPREEYKRLMANRSEIDKLLRDGAERARAKSVPFMAKLREAMGI